MIRRGWKILVAVAASAAGAALLSACASSAAPATSVRDSGPKTAAQRTASLDFAVTAPDDSGKPQTSDGTGGVDFVAKLVRGLFTVNGVPGVVDGSNANGIVQGQFIYAQLVGKAAHPFGLTQDWIKIDLRQLANIPGLNLGTITVAGLINPHVLFLFAGGISAATKLGDETVNGTKVTHYRATVDLNQAVKSLTGDDATIINKDLASYVSPTFPEDVWIDGSGLMRKVTFAVDVKGVAGAPPIRQSVSYQFRTFGVSVDTTLPPANDTANLTDVLAKVAAQQAGP